MKRHIRNLILLLLLGAIINVAVAWTASFAHQYRLQVSPLYSTTVIPKTTAPSQGHQRMVRIHVATQFGSRMEQFGDAGGTLVATDLHCGWPVLALCNAAHLDESRPYSSTIIVAPRNPGTSGYHLPFRPLWPGFAINTIFYAAILWLLLAFPFTLRRWRRIKRGLCLKCGYDLRGSTSQTCPECGKAVRT